MFLFNVSGLEAAGLLVVALLLETLATTLRKGAEYDAHFTRFVLGLVQLLFTVMAFFYAALAVFRFGQWFLMKAGS